MKKISIQNDNVSGYDDIIRQWRSQEFLMEG